MSYTDEIQRLRIRLTCVTWGSILGAALIVWWGVEHTSGLRDELAACVAMMEAVK